jgi:hypothetical protein
VIAFNKAGSPFVAIAYTAAARTGHFLSKQALVSYQMKSDVTPAQLAAVASVSALALALGMIASGCCGTGWLIHCHIGHHITNNNVETRGGGGLMVVMSPPLMPAAR